MYLKIKRWNESKYEVRGLPEELIGKYEGVLDADDNFYVITRISTIHGIDQFSTESVPRQIAVSFNEQIYRNIIASHGVSFHKEFLQNTTMAPLEAALYLWMRRVIKHSAVPKKCTWEHLYRELDNSSDMREFKRNINNIYKRILKDEKSPAKHLCYYLAPMEGNKGYLIWADPKDSIVGKSSKYALSKAQDALPELP